MMEFLGIPVVVTVQDLLSLGGIAIVICAYVILIPIWLVTEIARGLLKLRKRHF